MSLFRVPFLVAVTLAIAFGGGIASTLSALDATVGFGSIRLGAWEAFPRAQLEEADPYAKSHRARAGKLLYGVAEGLSFTANVDDLGRPLTAGCRYRISGQTPPARLWTLFVTPDAGVEGRPDGLNSWTVQRAGDGTFSIWLSIAAHPGNWIALPAGGPFRLTLTLLDTPTAGSSGLVDLAMPHIEQTGCGNAV